MNEDANEILQGIIKNKWGESFVQDSDSDEEESDSNSQIADEDVEIDEVEESTIPEAKISNITLEYINSDSYLEYITNFTNKREATLEKNDAEDTIDGSNQKPKVKKRKRTTLPKTLRGVMGAANLCSAQQKYEESIKMCLEIIRQAPYAPEPYHLLGYVLNETGQREKALQFSLISAYLQPDDLQQWKDLADQAVELNETRIALRCYDRAIKIDPKNLELYWAKCELLEKMGDNKKLLACYEGILEQIADKKKMFFDLSKLIAELYGNYNNMAAAAQVLYKAFFNAPEEFSVYLVNDLLNMKFALKKHKDALKILQHYCNITFESPKEMNLDEDLQEFLESATSCCIPDDIITDFLAKLIICLIHLRASHLVPPLIDELLESDSTDEIHDLYLDVADAYMEAGEFTTPLTLLTRLFSSTQADQATVWIRYADCLCALGREDEAMEAYQKVVGLCPKHLSARLSLSSLQKKRGMTEEAICTLKQDYLESSSSPLDTEILYQRCKLLYAKDMVEEFITEARLLMCSHSFPIRIPIQIKAVLFNKTNRKKIEALREIQTSCAAELAKFPTPTFTPHSIPETEIWDICLKLIQKLFELKRFEELESTALQLLSSSFLLKDSQKAEEANFLALMACTYNNSVSNAFTLIKSFCLKNQHSIRSWNLFNRITLMSDSIRHHRFCMRFLLRGRESLPPVLLMLAHNSLALGTYRFAISAYTELLEAQPDDPLLHLNIGVACIHMACQKFQARKNYLLFQGLVYIFRYLELRGPCQESLYNLGRAFQQLGLNHWALHYYRQGLASAAPMDLRGGPDTFSLNCEIAFNMNHILEASNCHSLARYYLHKYCVI